MNAPSRFEALEKNIVDALRRAPGAEPSGDLDARIRARAHAAVRPAKRSQAWFSMAAGIVVLLGTGLALQISQQVEQMPSALRPPAAVVAEPAVVATDSLQSAETGRTAEAEQMAAAASAAVEQADSPVIAEERKQAASAKSELGLRQMQPKALAEPAPGLADAPADDRMGSDLGAAMPFPADSRAEPVLESIATSELARPAPPAEPGLPSASPAPAAPAVQAAPEFAAPAKPSPRADEDATALRDNFSSAKADEGHGATASGASAATRMREATPARAKIAPAKSSNDIASSAAIQHSERFDDGVEQIRAALAKGDARRAHELLDELRKNYSDRPLPDDLREWADALQ